MEPAVRRIVICLVCFVVALAPFSAAPMAGAQDDCTTGPAAGSRACLIEVADQYFTALVAREPWNAPVAPDVTLTVNGTIGEDLWDSVTAGPTNFQVYVPDPESRQIAGIAVIELYNLTTEIAFRFKVVDGLITEADHVVVPITDASALANLRRARPELLEPVPPAERLSPEALRSLAYSEYDGREGTVRPLPYAADCVRQENGVQAACGPQLTVPEVSYVDSFSLVRTRVADPETGLVFSLAYNVEMFRSIAVSGYQPFQFVAAHINKVRDDAIQDIEAVGFGAPSPERTTRLSPATSGRMEWSTFTR